MEKAEKMKNIVFVLILFELCSGCSHNRKVRERRDALGEATARASHIYRMCLERSATPLLSSKELAEAIAAASESQCRTEFHAIECAAYNFRMDDRDMCTEAESKRRFPLRVEEAEEIRVQERSALVHYLLSKRAP